MKKAIILAVGLALEFVAIYYFEKKLNEGIRQACEYYNVATPSEGLIIILEQSRNNRRDKES